MTKAVATYNVNGEEKLLWERKEQFKSSHFKQLRIIKCPDFNNADFLKICCSKQEMKNFKMNYITGFVINSTTSRKKCERNIVGPYAQNLDDHMECMCGTTYFCSRYHRQFLHRPNPYIWREDMNFFNFCGVKILRTGIFTAWEDIMDSFGNFNQSWLNALDCWLHNAKKHSIHVQFTIFSFSPPAWGGMNVWLDSKSLTAQMTFVKYLTRRYSALSDLSWDLINEPSWGDPHRLWSDRGRPNGDLIEKETFKVWLQSKVGSDEKGLTELRSRWRLTYATLPDWKSVRPPTDADFSYSAGDTNDRWMCRLVDWTLFTQEMFIKWTRSMVSIIKEYSPNAAVGVGQDEAGCRPTPLLFGSAVDYTATHPYWNNDDVHFDLIMAQMPNLPLFAQEVGVMLSRRIDNSYIRSELENAERLRRKLMICRSFGVAGIIQWCWYTNSLMLSSNERQIGLVRTDGSVKPEFFVMFDFLKQSSVIIAEPIRERRSSVGVVVPFYGWFGRPAKYIEALKTSIRVLYSVLNMSVIAIPDVKIDDYADVNLAFIVVPYVQYTVLEVLEALCAFSRKGCHVLISGCVEQDPYGRFLDLKSVDMVFHMESARMPVQACEILNGPLRLPVSFQQGGQSDYIFKAHNELRIFRHSDKGSIFWSGVPVEAGDSQEAVEALYRFRIDN